MNMLSKSDVFAENKLFATLDPTPGRVFGESTAPLLREYILENMNGKSDYVISGKCLA